MGGHPQLGSLLSVDWKARLQLSENHPHGSLSSEKKLFLIYVKAQTARSE
jgi:hypothetical protein